jgi:surfeit locus 1 family protein
MNTPAPARAARTSTRNSTITIFMTDDYSTRTPRAISVRARIAWFLVALCCSALTARLGVWQLSRAHQKLDAAALVEERAHLEPLAASALAREEAPAKAQWERRIALRGQWVAGHTVFLANRVMDGMPGFVVVTPLRLPEGDAVVVERGWVPLDQGDPGRMPVVAPPPEGEVEVVGHLAAWPPHWIEIGRQPAGAIRQNLERAAFAAESGIALRPLALVEDATPANAADGLARRWTPPAVNVTVNYGYAFQWFAMSIGFLVLYAWLAFFRHRLPASDDAGPADRDHP